MTVLAQDDIDGGDSGRERGGWRCFGLEALARMRNENLNFYAHFDLRLVSLAIKLIGIAHASSFRMIIQVNRHAEDSFEPYQNYSC